MAKEWSTSFLRWETDRLPACEGVRTRTQEGTAGKIEVGVGHDDQPPPEGEKLKISG